MKNCFLFQKTNNGEHRVLFWIWNWALPVIMSIGLSCLIMLLGLGNYGIAILKGELIHPLILLLNVIPIVFLTALLYLLTNRSWLAFLITAAFTLAAGVGNYFKLLFRDDPFMFSDVTAIGTAFGIADRYTIAVDRRIAFCIVCVLIATAVLFFFARGRMKKGRFIGALIVLICAYPLHFLYTSDDIYNNKTQNFEYINRWSSTQLYISKGFAYPFLHSVKDAFPEKPEGYSERRAEEILSSLSDEDIPEKRKVNIIAIQLEAFSDLEALGVEGISPEVYKSFRTLQDESVTGRLVTNIFAGGTIDTERCFLTGNDALTDFRQAAGSYVRYLASQGYAVTGSHSCYDWFYNRKNVNGYLGFDSYWFYENRYSEIAGGAIAYDDILLPDILTLYEERDVSVPYFSFSVTYQGHGPYSADTLEWGDGYWDGEYSQDSTYYIVNNYLGGVKNTADDLLMLTRELQKDDAPVVLVVYGDHNPWLGNGNSAYIDLGVDLDVSTETGFYNYYCAPCLIWANGAAKDALGNDFTGSFGDVSPCFLMNEVFSLCSFGAGPGYMQLMNEVLESGVTVVNTTGVYVENGKMTSTLSEKAAQALNDAETAAFYRRTHCEW